MNAVLGGFYRYDSLVEELLVIKVQAIFFVSFFCWNWKKRFNLVQSLRITYELRRENLKWLFMHELGWKPIPYKLQTCGNNSGISSWSESELQGPNAYRIEFYIN